MYQTRHFTCNLTHSWVSSCHFRPSPRAERGGEEWHPSQLPLRHKQAPPVTPTSKSSLWWLLFCSLPPPLKLIIKLRQCRAWKLKPKLHFPAVAINGRQLLTVQRALTVQRLLLQSHGEKGGCGFGMSTASNEPAESSNTPAMLQPCKQRYTPAPTPSLQTLSRQLLPAQLCHALKKQFSQIITLHCGWKHQYSTWLKQGPPPH